MKSSVNQPKKDDDESVIEPPREGEVEEQRILAPNQANSSAIASKVPGMTHVKQDEDELWARKMNNAMKSDDDVPTPTERPIHCRQQRHRFKSPWCDACETR
uniref:Uncharacterized protein n=1 Tax=Ditylum brightwellii TaxID=49249 RepID=A0A7S4SHY8_9STRA